MKIFVYGTLRDPDKLAHVLGFGFSGSAVANRYLGEARFPGHAVVMGENGYLTVVAREGGTCCGHPAGRHVVTLLQATCWGCREELGGRNVSEHAYASHVARGLLVEISEADGEDECVDSFEGVWANFYERATATLADGTEATYWRQVEMSRGES